MKKLVHILSLLATLSSSSVFASTIESFDPVAEFKKNVNAALRDDPAYERFMLACITKDAIQTADKHVQTTIRDASTFWKNFNFFDIYSRTHPSLHDAVKEILIKQSSNISLQAAENFETEIINNFKEKLKSDFQNDENSLNTILSEIADDHITEVCNKSFNTDKLWVPFSYKTGAELGQAIRIYNAIQDYITVRTKIIGKMMAIMVGTKNYDVVDRTRSIIAVFGTAYDNSFDEYHNTYNYDALDMLK